jgi:pyruvate formate lyase activating enzyme
MRGDGRIQCDLCPRLCRLQDGQRAFCFVRERRGDELVLNTYGRSTGFCIDPIEKKPLNHFLPGTPVLSFGTAGCNLGCRFCQNWDISKSREVERASAPATPQAIARAALDAECRSVAFTYNDPVIWAEYAIDTAIACHERDIRTVAVTAGYIGAAARRDFFAHLDAVNIDLKSFSETFYKKLCFAELAPVLDTIDWVKAHTKTWLELTTLVIPGQNDDDDELRRLSRWCVEHLGPETPLHFSAFHPDFKMTDVPRTPPATLRRARAIALDEGAKHVYTGNVHDRVGDATHCASCDATLIQRDWYELVSWNLHDGRCSECGHALAGVFEAQPGQWGARRAPLRILPS